MINSDSAPSQSPWPDENEAEHSESQENKTDADDADDEAATITRREEDSVASEVQTDNADNNLPSNPPPISLEQLVAEVKGIYAGLLMIESKCIEMDKSLMTDGLEAQSRPSHGTQQAAPEGQRWRRLSRRPSPPNSVQSRAPTYPAKSRRSLLKRPMWPSIRVKTRQE